LEYDGGGGDLWTGDLVTGDSAAGDFDTGDLDTGDLGTRKVEVAGSLSFVEETDDFDPEMFGDFRGL